MPLAAGGLAGSISPVAPHAALGFWSIAAACGIGIAAGFASGLLTAVVYFFEDAFHKLPIHWMWWPAIGRLFVGIGGWIDPRVLGVGYELIHSLLNGQILGAALFGLVFGKALVCALALGSGTSGGVLAPLLILGGALGVVIAQWLPIGAVGVITALDVAQFAPDLRRSHARESERGHSEREQSFN